METTFSREASPATARQNKDGRNRLGKHGPKACVWKMREPNAIARPQVTAGKDRHSFHTMKHSGISINSLADEYVRQIKRQISVPAFLNQPTKKSSLRQKTKRNINQLESDFLLYLKTYAVAGKIKSQAITLVLANGCRYTPDFCVFGHENQLIAYEVKGPFFRDDAKVKLKVAASVFPEIEFVLAERKNGAWTETKIYP